MKQVTVYVTAPAGASIAGYGHRRYGESFELPRDVADEVCARDGFSKDDPNKPSAPATRVTKFTKQEESDDDSSQ